MRRAAGAGCLIAALVVTAAACSAVDPLDPSYGAAFITREHPNKYGITVADGVTTVAAATGNSTSTNERLVFRRLADAERTDGEACATWVGDGLIEDGQPGGVAPLPWRLCVRLSDTSLDFLVWPTARPQPDWGDANSGGHVDLDPGLTRPGRFCWYAGHLPPGESTAYVDMTVGDIPG